MEMTDQQVNRQFRQEVHQMANKLVTGNEKENSKLAWSLHEAIYTIIRCRLNLRRIAHLKIEDIPEAKRIASQISNIILEGV